MMLLPLTMGLTLASRMGTAGSIRKIPVFGPVSVAVKVSVSLVRADLRVTALLSIVVGSRLQAAALTCTKSGEEIGVAWIVFTKVLSKKYEIPGAGPVTVMSTSLENDVVSDPLLKNATAVLRIIPLALAEIVTLKLKLALAP